MNERTMFDLEPGEMLRVAQKYVSVYSDTRKAYWYYSLKGNYIGAATEEQMRLNPEEHFIFGDNCIWVKKSWIKTGLPWQMVDYEGNDIFGSFIKNVTFSETTRRVSFVFNGYDMEELYSKNQQYLILNINDDEAAIYSINGECLLERGFYKNVTVVEYYVLLTTSDDNMRLYDLKTKKFVGGLYTDIKVFGRAIILKTTDKCYLFNLKTGNIVEECDVYLAENIEWADTITFGLWLYRDGKCGFWICSSTYLKQVVPIEYAQIILDGEEGISARGKNCRHIDIKQLMETDEDDNENFEITSEEDQTCATIVYKGVEVKTGDVLWLRERFFAVSKDTETWDEEMWYGQKMAMCYTTEGEFIGKTAVIYNGNDEISDFSCVELKNYLVLDGCTKEQLKHDISSKVWCIYDFKAKEFLPHVFTSVFSDECKKYLTCNAPCFSQHEKSIMYVFSLKSGKQLFKLDGYKKMYGILGKYFEILDFNDEMWVFDEKGKKIFDEGISFSFFNTHGMIVEHVKNGYNVYDCVNKEKSFLHADTFEALRGQSDKKLIVATLNNKYGLYAYSEKKGFYQVIPVRYDFIQATADYILAQIFTGNLIDDIYEFDGKLISSTRLAD